MQNPLDKLVGKRLRARCIELGITQTKFAAALDVTFQQLQKYEKAVNRINPGRLFIAAEFLEVPVAFFFDKLPYAIPNCAMTRSRACWNRAYARPSPRCQVP